MRTILCLIDSLGPGGAQRQMSGLAVFLKEQGYDVIVACYHDNRFYVDKLLTAGVPYVFLKKAEKAALRIWRIARYVRRIKPDIVISFLETPSVCSCIAHITNRSFRLIVSERNTTQYTGLKEKVRFNLFRFADHIVPNAFAQEEYIRGHFPFLSYKVKTIPNYVDLEHFFPISRQRHETPLIVIVATVWASKNTLGFIDAMAEIKDNGIHFHVKWFGKEDTHLEYYNQCEERIQQHELSDIFEVKSKTTCILKEYQNADFFCLPSFYEGTPNVICEAMACGLPVACSDVCDNSHYVKDGLNGFLFNPHDTSSITFAIKRMLSLDDATYQLFCDNSRKRAERLFSKERFVHSYNEVLAQ